MTVMKYRLLTWYVTLAVFLAPVVALAAKEDEETALLEGRLEGYAVNVKMPGGSTALTWMLVCVISVIAIATLFKNAKRTHLD
jgi:hypothetical protein